MWSSPCRTTQWWYICYLFIWTYLYIAKTNYAEFPRFFFFLFLFVCLRYGYIFTSPRRTIQSLHVLLFVLLSVSAVTLYLHRHFEPCRVYIFHSLFLVCLSCEYNFTSPCRTLQSWHILLFVSAVNISLHRHDKLCRVYVFYFWSCCLSPLWIYLYIDTTNHTEFTCFTFCLSSQWIYFYIASTNLPCCLSQLWICFYIATTNCAALTCFTFCLLVCSSCEYIFTSPRWTMQSLHVFLFSCCLSPLWIYLYIATTKYTEFSCFTFCLLVCLSGKYNFYIAMTNSIELACFTFYLIVCLSREHHHVGLRNTD